MPLEYYFMLAGLVLLLIEFVVPGFGIFGVSGMVCLTVGGFYVLGGNAWAALVLLAVYLFFVLVITLLCVYLPKESKYNPFVLWTRQKNSEGYTGGKNWSMLVGKGGTALTTLRPAGTILVDGKRLDVSSQGDYIEKSAPVIIVRVEGSKIFVEQTKE